MIRDRLVVAGNGMAGLRFIEELLAVAPGRFDVTVIGGEPRPAYNRVLLSSMLAGEICDADVMMKSAGWYAGHGIRLLTGEPAVHLDVAARKVTLLDGAEVPFDTCVLATGSEPIRLPVPGVNLDGVTTFRTLADIEILQRAAAAGTPAVVIGGGLLGIEAAYGLSRAGVPVTLIHLMDRLMERQLDERAAALLRSAIEARGIEVILGAETAAIHGAVAVASIELKDGRSISCGLAVMAVGIKADADLAKRAGLATNRGIVVDDRLQTSYEGIYAIGECAEHRGICYGLVEPAYEQARVLAAHLAGHETHYEGSVLATNLKVSGVPVFSAGDFEGTSAETIVLADDAVPSYRKLVLRDGRLAGCVLAGDTTDALWYLDLIRSGQIISGAREMLVFGRAHSEAA